MLNGAHLLFFYVPAALAIVGVFCWETWKRGRDEHSDS